MVEAVNTLVTGELVEASLATIVCLPEYPYFYTIIYQGRKYINIYAPPDGLTIEVPDR
jgi:hypothetical protein